MVLGIAIDYDRERGVLFLSQEAKINKILEDLKMAECKPTKTPALTTRLTTPEGEPSQEEIDFMSRVPYRQTVGSLTYIYTSTRPDIGFALNQVAKRVANPRKEHWVAVKRIVRYLQGTKDYGICYVRGGAKFNPQYWSDADHAGDKETRKSHTGYLSMVLGGSLTWRSYSQKSVALSSFGAELMAIADALKDCIWQRRVLHNLGLLTTGATAIFEDNQGTIAVACQDPGTVSSKTKHIAVRFFFIREHVECGDVEVIYCCTEEMIADIFTKPLGHIKFMKFRRMLGVAPKRVLFPDTDAQQ